MAQNADSPDSTAADTQPAVTITSLFDLDAIVLAGPSFAIPGSIYQTVIQREVDRRSFARRAHPVRVVPSASGSDAAAIGAAVLMLQSALSDGRARLPGSAPPS